MKILLLAPYYAPDLGPSAPLFTMLAEGWVRLGHQVCVIAAVPHYPSGLVPAPYRKQWIQNTEENGVEVIRVRIPSVQRGNLALRMLQFLAYQMGACIAGTGKSYDVVFVANPALWVFLPFFWLVALRKKPAIFSVQDVYPDVGVTLGIFRHRPVIQAVAALEKFCLHRSAVVQIISDSFRPGLQALGVPDDKMVTISNWVDTDLIVPLAKTNTFSNEFDLTGRFVVLYAGNIGLSQGFAHVLEAAEQLASYPDVHFVFVGDGCGREELLAEVERRALKNVQFLPFQPRARLPEVLASADISLVVLKPGIGSGSLPSKVFSILASGRPILASVDKNCETWKLIQQADAGICVSPEDAVSLTEAILKLRGSPGLRQQLGVNGRQFVEQYHSAGAAAVKFEDLFAELLAGRATQANPNKPVETPNRQARIGEGGLK